MIGQNREASEFDNTGRCIYTILEINQDCVEEERRMRKRENVRKRQE